MRRWTKEITNKWGENGEKTDFFFILQRKWIHLLETGAKRSQHRTAFTQTYELNVCCAILKEFLEFSRFVWFFDLKRKAFPNKRIRDRSSQWIKWNKIVKTNNRRKENSKNENVQIRLIWHKIFTIIYLKVFFCFKKKQKFRQNKILFFSFQFNLRFRKFEAAFIKLLLLFM